MPTQPLFEGKGNSALNPGEVAVISSEFDPTKSATLRLIITDKDGNEIITEEVNVVLTKKTESDALSKVDFGKYAHLSEGTIMETNAEMRARAPSVRKIEPPKPSGPPIDIKVYTENPNALKLEIADKKKLMEDFMFYKLKLKKDEGKDSFGNEMYYYIGILDSDGRYSVIPKPNTSWRDLNFNGVLGGFIVESKLDEKSWTGLICSIPHESTTWKVTKPAIFEKTEEDGKEIYVLVEKGEVFQNI
tara:strand:- start:8147 stop:8884 length:738 start_codon:yes stop_codon:yes gene_type:complete